MVAHATSLADWVVILPVLLCLMGAALLLMLRGFLRVQLLICAAVLLAVLVCDGVLMQRVLAAGPLTMTMGNWPAPFGISFTADVMGALFALAAAFVTACVLLYMAGDTPEGAVRDGVYPLVLLLLAGVSGAFLTGDLFNLYVWFEVMLIASFGLVILAGRPLQLDAAVKYGLLNFLATTLFLIALGLLYGLVGTLNMADIVGAATRAEPAPLAATAALFALAFGMKAAVFPVNAWLPASYHAPPPALSVLLGGLLTKVGAYAFLRTLVMLLPETRAVLGPAVTAIAIATVILAPLSAMAETNLRRAIGFLLIGGVGIIVLSAPQSHISAIEGGVFYVFHAMLTLAALYLVAGLVERATGATDTRAMHGLYSANSLISILFLVLVFAVSGLPPFLGFWPKLLLVQGFLAEGAWASVFALLFNSLLTLVAGTRLWSHIFWRGTAERVALPAQPLGGAALLTGTVILLGLWPAALFDAARIAAGDLLAPARYIASVGLSP